MDAIAGTAHAPGSVCAASVNGDEATTLSRVEGPAVRILSRRFSRPANSNASAKVEEEFRTTGSTINNDCLKRFAAQAMTGNRLTPGGTRGRCRESIAQPDAPRERIREKPVSPMKEHPTPGEHGADTRRSRGTSSRLFDHHGWGAEVHVEADLIVPPNLPARKAKYRCEIVNSETFHVTESLLPLIPPEPAPSLAPLGGASLVR